MRCAGRARGRRGRRAGPPSAAYTSLCCSISESPSNCGATTVAWKWSKVPVVSTTVTSAPGRCALIRVSISSVVGMLTARYQRGSGRSRPRLEPMQVTLPDGAKLELPDGATGLDAARAIGPKLAEATAAVEVDGELRDLRLPLPDGAQLRSCGSATRTRCACSATRRRTCWPRPSSTSTRRAKIAIGPAIDDGFYYDFEFPDGPPGEADLERIEAEMRRILAAGPYPIERSLTTRDEASRASARRTSATRSSSPRDLPEGEEITEYTHDGFVDLCRGPHLQDTKPIRAFKLTSIAGAYWRGDSQQHDADAHLRHGLLHAHRSSRSTCTGSRRRAAATIAGWAPSSTCSTSPRSRPARRSGIPRGWPMWNALTAFWREQNALRGYREVRTPILFDSELWKRSGHWDNYRENMFFSEVDDRVFGLKPMNCPGHVEIYNHTRRSYRDLPLRLAEQGLVHRNEASGVMHGLHARAPHHAGRRPHLLHLGAGRGRGDRLPRARRVHLRDARPAGARRALDAPGQAHRQRGAVGSHGGRARERRSRAPAGTTASTRATARSTRRRSTCT